jgi:hypothetical protein
MKISELDTVFLSYDEPNADIHYADLSNKIPWAKRIHGIKGSDAAHKEAARISETAWLVTVDADNIVDSRFFDLDIDVTNPKIQVYSWLARNNLNGLLYGNGGLKIWKKDFILNMKTHEDSVSERAQVDFCWEDGYVQFKECYSETIVTGSPFQAWRAGFREGVKMTLFDGVKVPPMEIKERIWWHNIHRLRMWSTIGTHEENGKYAILGARMGTWMTNCTNWNYVDVRDFEILRNIYEQKVDHEFVERDAQDLGMEIKQELGLHWPWLDSDQSRYVLELYNETIKLTKTYYKNHV